MLTHSEVCQHCILKGSLEQYSARCFARDGCQNTLWYISLPYHETDILGKKMRHRYLSISPRNTPFRLITLLFITIDKIVSCFICVYQASPTFFDEIFFSQSSRVLRTKKQHGSSLHTKKQQKNRMPLLFVLYLSGRVKICCIQLGEGQVISVHSASNELCVREFKTCGVVYISVLPIALRIRFSVTNYPQYTVIDLYTAFDL